MWAELSSFEFYIGPSCLGPSLDLWKSCLGSSIVWTKLTWAKLVLGRVLLYLQDRRLTGSDLGLNCCQKLFAGDIGCHYLSKSPRYIRLQVTK